MVTPASSTRYYRCPPSWQALLADLVNSNRLSQAQANAALASPRTPSRHHQSRLHPLEYLASLKLEDAATAGQVLDLDHLSQWFATQIGQPYYAIDPLKIDVAAILPIMSHAYAKRHDILTVEVNADHIVVASAQPWQTSWEENLKHVHRKTIRRVIANPAAIRRYTQEFYQLAQSIQGATRLNAAASGTIRSFEHLLELGHTAADANDQHIVNLVDWLLQYACEQRASDIHIEPKREQCHLRFRIDGLLHLIYQMPAQVTAAIISRLKILGRMNVAEKRQPQDGRLKTRHPDGNEIELRLATLPTAFGEKLVMRLFDPEVLVKPLSELGFSEADANRWRSMSTCTSGIVLVTGPTGSGKTTTLYSTLKTLATPAVNICTLEDPIELVEPNFNQMQVQPAIDLNFATGLRALLRQDPDIIMVGEIRDLETAEMVIQAALTGHLVISTLHTNDAPSAVTRLLELGIPAYLIKTTVLGVMAQRLVRTLCPACKQQTSIANQEWQYLTQPWSVPIPATVYVANGCTQCRHTGYKGRTGLYESLLMSNTLQALLTPSLDTNALRQQAIKEGMYSLRFSGSEKVAAGLTTVTEVLRVTPDVAPTRSIP